MLQKMCSDPVIDCDYREICLKFYRKCKPGSAQCQEVQADNVEMVRVDRECDDLHSAFDLERRAIDVY